MTQKVTIAACQFYISDISAAQEEMDSSSLPTGDKCLEDRIELGRHNSSS